MRRHPTTVSENVFEQAPTQIEEHAESVGSERLDRSNLEIVVTAIIGGGEVSLGGLASMAVLGELLDVGHGIGLYQGLVAAGLVFPVGFVFVIMAVPNC